MVQAAGNEKELMVRIIELKFGAWNFDRQHPPGATSIK